MGDMRAFYAALKAVYGPSLRQKYPADGQGSHLPALVRAFGKPLKRLKHRAGVFTGQDSPSECEAGAR